MQECASSFIERKTFAFLSDYQDFSRFLMYIGRYQNALERRIDDATLKKNIYKLHIEELEKIIRKIKHVEIENIVDFFKREKVKNKYSIIYMVNQGYQYVINAVIQ